jgi:8-oxo-dGTP pyrophosphatase MutT (NUDIX family)
VCRDLLNPQAVHALSEAGANLVLAPSMSETLLPFGGPVAQLVGSTQAVIAVANNPADWSLPNQPNRDSPPGRALFGHPGFAQQTRQVHAPDHLAGVALLRVGPGRLRWHSSEDVSGIHASSATTTGTAPVWVHSLAQHTTPVRPRSSDPVTLRAAAVLVILTDGRDGPDQPHVLLTGRALDLTHYSGELVFPGGAAESGDRDAIETALREAREEIGLDPASVHVIGVLPAFGLPDSGFLVTPVLAWSHEPRYLHAANIAEVTTIHTVPLSARGTEQLKTGQPRRPAVEAGDGGSTASEDDTVRVGAMTSTIIELLAARIPATSRWATGKRG